LSGRHHHHHQQHTPSAGQTVKPQPQQPKVGGGQGPGPGGGGGTQVREDCRLKYLQNSRHVTVGGSLGVAFTGLAPRRT
jgi:hypothetical protein